MNRRNHRTVRRLRLAFVVALAAAVVVPTAHAVDPNKIDEGSPALTRSQTPPDKHFYADGVLRRTDGTPLSSPVFEPTGSEPAVSGSDWSDMSVGALAGFAAAALLGLALTATLRMRQGRVAHS